MRFTKSITLAVCAASSFQVFAADTVKTAPAYGVLASESGRFVFGQISDARRDQYMLDTKTGRLWRIATTYTKAADGSKGEPYPVLEAIPYISDSGKEINEPSNK